MPSLGLTLQHLSQFNLADRPGTLATLPLDRGPGVIAVVPGGPAAAAGVRAGDVLLAIDGVALPPELGLAEPFAAPRAHARADAVADLLARPETRSLTLLRDGNAITVQVRPRPTCPSHVHLARSDQRNAFADGRHVFLTTGLLRRLSNDDELAFVIGHELAHNILGHATILRAAKASGQPGRKQLVRQTERDADRLAGELLLDAGFDPVAGAQALTRLGGGDLGIDLSAEHQSDADRIAAMRALVAARLTQ